MRKAGEMFTPAEARRLARLMAAWRGNPAQAGLATLDAATRALVRRAISAGLLEEGEEGRLAVRAEAAGFLRRLYVADGEDAHAAQHG